MHLLLSCEPHICTQECHDCWCDLQQQKHLLQQQVEKQQQQQEQQKRSACAAAAAARYALRTAETQLKAAVAEQQQEQQQHERELLLLRQRLVIAEQEMQQQQLQQQQQVLQGGQQIEELHQEIDELQRQLQAAHRQLQQQEQQQAQKQQLLQQQEEVIHQHREQLREARQQRRDAVEQLQQVRSQQRKRLQQQHQQQQQEKLLHEALQKLQEQLEEARGKNSQAEADLLLQREEAELQALRCVELQMQMQQLKRQQQEQHVQHQRQQRQQQREREEQARYLEEARTMQEDQLTVLQDIAALAEELHQQVLPQLLRLKFKQRPAASSAKAMEPTTTADRHKAVAVLLQLLHCSSTAAKEAQQGLHAGAVAAAAAAGDAEHGNSDGSSSLSSSNISNSNTSNSKISNSSVKRRSSLWSSTARDMEAMQQERRVDANSKNGSKAVKGLSTGSPTAIRRASAPPAATAPTAVATVFGSASASIAALSYCSSYTAVNNKQRRHSLDVHLQHEEETTLAAREEEAAAVGENRNRTIAGRGKGGGDTSATAGARQRKQGAKDGAAIRATTAPPVATGVAAAEGAVAEGTRENKRLWTEKQLLRQLRQQIQELRQAWAAAAAAGALEREGRAAAEQHVHHLQDMLQQQEEQEKQLQQQIEEQRRLLRQQQQHALQQRRLLQQHQQELEEIQTARAAEKQRHSSELQQQEQLLQHYLQQRSRQLLAFVLEALRQYCVYFREKPQWQQQHYCLAAAAPTKTAAAATPSVAMDAALIATEKRVECSNCSPKALLLGERQHVDAYRVSLQNSSERVLAPASSRRTRRCSIAETPLMSVQEVQQLLLQLQQHQALTHLSDAQDSEWIQQQQQQLTVRLLGSSKRQSTGSSNTSSSSVSSSRALLASQEQQLVMPLKGSISIPSSNRGSSDDSSNCSVCSVGGSSGLLLQRLLKLGAKPEVRQLQDVVLLLHRLVLSVAASTYSWMRRKQRMRSLFAALRRQQQQLPAKQQHRHYSYRLLSRPALLAPNNERDSSRSEIADSNQDNNGSSSSSRHSRSSSNSSGGEDNGNRGNRSNSRDSMCNTENENDRHGSHSRSYRDTCSESSSSSVVNMRNAPTTRKGRNKSRCAGGQEFADSESLHHDQQLLLSSTLRHSKDSSRRTDIAVRGDGSLLSAAHEDLKESDTAARCGGSNNNSSTTSHNTADNDEGSSLETKQLLQQEGRNIHRAAFVDITEIEGGPAAGLGCTAKLFRASASDVQNSHTSCHVGVHAQAENPAMQPHTTAAACRLPCSNSATGNPYHANRSAPAECTGVANSLGVDEERCFTSSSQSSSCCRVSSSISSRSSDEASSRSSSCSSRRKFKKGICNGDWSYDRSFYCDTTTSAFYTLQPHSPVKGVPKSNQQSASRRAKRADGEKQQGQPPLQLHLAAANQHQFLQMEQGEETPYFPVGSLSGRSHSRSSGSRRHSNSSNRTLGCSGSSSGNSSVSNSSSSNLQDSTSSRRAAGETPSAASTGEPGISQTVSMSTAGEAAAALATPPVSSGAAAATVAVAGYAARNSAGISKPDAQGIFSHVSTVGADRENAPAADGLPSLLQPIKHTHGNSSFSSRGSEPLARSSSRIGSFVSDTSLHESPGSPQSRGSVTSFPTT